MAEHLLRNLKISPESEDVDLKNLIEIIKPSWNLERLKVKKLSGGYSSRIVRCYIEDNAEDSVTIRIRHQMDILMKDYDDTLEVNAIQHLSKHGHFPKVYAIFANGYCYHYIEGKPMVHVEEKTGFVDERMLRAIAGEMAFIHSVKMEGIEYNEEGILKRRDFVFNNVNSEKSLANGLNKQVLLKEHAVITSFLRSKKPNFVLCHGDPHPGNYVWNEAEEKMTVVDWEGTYVGYQLGEIAHLFSTLSLFDDIFFKKNSKPMIEKGYEEKFVQYYIKAWRELQNDDKTVTEDDVARWMEEIEIFRLVPLHSLVTFAFNFPEAFVKFSGDSKILFLEDIRAECFAAIAKITQKILLRFVFVIKWIF